VVTGRQAIRADGRPHTQELRELLRSRVTCSPASGDLAVTAAAPHDPDGQEAAPVLRLARSDAGHPASVAGTRGRGRHPGSVLVAVATGMLFVLGVGLFAVSLDAQYRYVFHAKHQSAVSWVEALALDVGMAIFSLLALGLARAGKPAGSATSHRKIRS